MYSLNSGCFLCVWCFSRPFRPSVTSFTRVSSSLRPIQDISLQGDSLLNDVTLMGGNDSGIFVSSVQPGSSADKAGLREGHHLLMVRAWLAKDRVDWAWGSLETSDGRVKCLAMCVMRVVKTQLESLSVQRREQTDSRAGQSWLASDMSLPVSVLAGGLHPWREPESASGHLH